jgi:eukaryotic-like serine/threonine-protein kinase
MAMPTGAVPVATPMQRIIADVPTHGDFPAASRIVVRLRQTVAKENCAAIDVARVILADPGTASKVLRLVNSAFYRKGDEPISTITRAVMVLGFETIRDVATGLVVMEELLRRGRSSAFVRDGLRRSLLAGLLAQRLAPYAGYPNAEEAYLLGLFADWGILWLATYHPAELDRALAVAHERQLPIAVAVREVLGDGPEVLAGAILERWNFPASFADHFRHPAPSSPADAVPRAARLSALVQIAADYAHVVDGGAEATAPVLERCERVLGIRAETLLHAAESATEALREQLVLLGLGPLPPARPELHRATASPAAAPARRGDPGVALGLVGEIARSLVEQRDVNDVLLLVLEAVARCGGFDVVFLALLNRERDRLAGRLGYGAGVEEYLDRLAVPVCAGAGVLADVVLARTSRVVPAGSAADLAAPGMAPPRVPVASFIASPLVVRGKAVGVLVAARTGPPPVTADDLPIVELFCNQAAIALHQYAR